MLYIAIWEGGYHLCSKLSLPFFIKRTWNQAFIRGSFHLKKWHDCQPQGLRTIRGWTFELVTHFLPQKSMFKGYHLPPPTHQTHQETHHQFHLFFPEAQPVPPSTHNAWQHEPTWNFARRRARVNVPFWVAWRWRLVGWWTKPPALPAGTCGVNECLLYFFGGFQPPPKTRSSDQSKQGSHLGSRYHPGNKWFVDWWSSRERSHLRTLRL